VFIVFIIDFPISLDHVLQSCTGGILAKISKAFWDTLHMECSGRLRTGESV